MYRTLSHIVYIILFIIAYLSLGIHGSVAYIDVRSTDPIYTHIQGLQSVGGLPLGESETFDRDSAATRGFFSSMLGASRCRQCIVPDILQSIPTSIASIPMDNPYLYCMRDALASRAMTEKSSCDRGSTGFCEEDVISRIDAIRSLLQYSGIWDDYRVPSRDEVSIVFRDIETNSIDYGYVRRAYDIGMISPDSSGNIRPRDPITRGEAVEMSNILRIWSQCLPYFGVHDQAGNGTLRISGSGSTFILDTGLSDLEHVRWSLGDGTIRIGGPSGRISHTFSDDGTYTIRAYVVSRTGASLMSGQIRTSSNRDTDDDGIVDTDDRCPLIYGSSTNYGCPEIETGVHGATISQILAGRQTNATLAGVGTIRTNRCIYDFQTSRGIIIGSPVCDTCPCSHSAEFLSVLRPCDIVFPTILSPDLSSIYSRGGFYQLR